MSSNKPSSQNRGYHSQGSNANKSNQMNPNNASYWQSHGWSKPSGAAHQHHVPLHGNNRANQLNPNNAKYNPQSK